MNTTLTAERVHDYTEMLCEALKQNYIETAIRRQKFFAANETGNPEIMTKVTEQRIGEIKNGDHYTYVIETGRKYHKIIMVTESGSRSVHGFVDKKTGEMYMAASWKAPARNGVRYNLLCEGDLNWLLENADWAGSYLYKKG